MRENAPSRTIAATLVGLCLTVVVLLVLLLSGRGGGGGQPALPPTIRLVDGVPVGVRDTQAGALAAADNYVALASQSVEQNPSSFAALVAQSYLPSVRASVLAEAQQLRAGDTQNMRNYREGGRGIALIAARRLEHFTPRSANVTSWLAGIVWGPRFTPRQTWNLVETSLIWRDGGWLIASSRVAATPAPVPAIVYVQDENDRASAFDSALAGMSAPFYGTAEG